jgi:hypothetical protein
VSEFLQFDVLRQADVRYQAQAGQKVQGEMTLREALDRAADRISHRFSGKPLTEASVRMAIARSYVSIGHSKVALPHAERAFELFRESVGEDDRRILEAEVFLADCHAVAGDFTRVMRLREAIARRAARILGPSDPETIEAQQSVAIQMLSAGRLSEATKLYEGLIPLIEKSRLLADPHRDSSRTR